MILPNLMITYNKIFGRGDIGTQLWSSLVLFYHSKWLPTKIGMLPSVAAGGSFIRNFIMWWCQSHISCYSVQIIKKGQRYFEFAFQLLNFVLKIIIRPWYNIKWYDFTMSDWQTDASHSLFFYSVTYTLLQMFRQFLLFMM